MDGAPKKSPRHRLAILTVLASLLQKSVSDLLLMLEIH